MSIKMAVKEHFLEHSRHIKNHFYYIHGLNGVMSVNKDMNVLIREFNLKDTDKCAELFKEVFSSYPWYDDWTSFDQAKNYLMELIQNPVFEGFVAYEGQNIVAVCLGHKRSWWMGKEFFIDEFYVRNESQGNGIGTKMMDYVKEILIEENYMRLTLLTNKEIPAEEFYIKNGFYNNQNRTVMVNEL